MDRRSFIGAVALGIAGVPLPSNAQPAGKSLRIGLLAPGSASASATQVLLEAFRQGLRELGWFEGQNITIEYRFAEGRQEVLPKLVAELIRLNIVLIVAEGTVATQAAKSATGALPIVMATSGDPVGSGLVATLARPGGNVTGLTLLAAELSAKRLQLLKEIVPGVSRVAALWNSANPETVLSLRQTEHAAGALDL